MNTDQPFIGFWDVVELQRRVAGEWLHEYDFVPGEWQLCFDPDGRHSEFFLSGGLGPGIYDGVWSLDHTSGAVSLVFDEFAPEFVHMMFFDKTDGGYWLYLFEDALHISHDRDAIIAHHANERRRLRPATTMMEISMFGDE